MPQQGNDGASGGYPLAELQRVHNEHILALGMARLQWAQAELVEAQARHEHARASGLEDLLDQLGMALRQVRIEERAAHKRIMETRRRESFVRSLIRGKSIAAYPQVESAFLHFKDMLPTDFHLKLYEPLNAPEGTRWGNCFFPNGHQDQDGEEPPKDATANVLTLIEWSITKRYIAREGKPAQKAFVAMFGAIESVARQEAQRLENEALGFRNSTFKLWEPVKVIGVIASPAQQKLLDMTAQGK